MDVTILSLVDAASAAGCGRRAQVLACTDALRAAGATVEHHEADRPEGIDAALRTDNRLIVAADTDSQLRAVLRRASRVLAPAPSQRSDEIPDDRTLPDLPPLGVLPLAEIPDLVTTLGLPTAPADVAAAVVGGKVTRSDLLRHDGGGVTAHGVRIGGGDKPFRGRIALDDTIISDGSEAIATCVVANAAGYGRIDGLGLCEPDAADGQLDVAIAVPFTHRGFLKRRTRIEVRRARGRAVAITPLTAVPFLEDGAQGELNRKRTWWMERAVCGWYMAEVSHNSLTIRG